jgi:hypothetical protein
MTDHNQPQEHPEPISVDELHTLVALDRDRDWVFDPKVAASGGSTEFVQATMTSLSNPKAVTPPSGSERTGLVQFNPQRIGGGFVRVHLVREEFPDEQGMTVEALKEQTTERQDLGGPRQDRPVAKQPFTGRATPSRSSSTGGHHPNEPGRRTATNGTSTNAVTLDFADLCSEAQVRSSAWLSCRQSRPPRALSLRVTA